MAPGRSPDHPGSTPNISMFSTVFDFLCAGVDPPPWRAGAGCAGNQGARDARAGVLARWRGFARGGSCARWRAGAGCAGKSCARWRAGAGRAGQKLRALARWRGVRGAETARAGAGRAGQKLRALERWRGARGAEAARAGALARGARGRSCARWRARGPACLRWRGLRGAAGPRAGALARKGGMADLMGSSSVDGPTDS